jgi:glycosyltransferase involved in cell wall biosynthesis
VGYVLKKYPRISETFILNELLGLEAMGAEATVFSLRPADEGKFHRELADFRGHVHYVPDPKGGSPARLLARLSNRPIDVPQLQEYMSALPEGVRDSVLSQGVLVAGLAEAARLEHLHAHFVTVAAHVACVAHLLTGIPFTATAHAKDIFRHGVDHRLFRLTAEHSKAVITVCDANVHLIKGEYLSDSPARVVRIYNGLPLEAVPAPGEPREPNLVLSVGRLVEKKGFEDLLSAVAHLHRTGRPVRTMIIGDGPLLMPLRKWCEERGLSQAVTFLGARPREEVLSWMRRARVFALPCVTGADGNKDALPTVLLEALACGLPSVSTPISGIPEIIADGEQGLIVPEGDVDAIAQAIEHLLVMEEDWSRMSASGPRRAKERVDRARTLPLLLEIFREPTPLPRARGVDA